MPIRRRYCISTEVTCDSTKNASILDKSALIVPAKIRIAGTQVERKIKRTDKPARADAITRSFRIIHSKFRAENFKTVSGVARGDELALLIAAQLRQISPLTPQKLAVFIAVSYTHLTLPTIYSV